MEENSIKRACLHSCRKLEFTIMSLIVICSLAQEEGGFLGGLEDARSNL